MPSGKEYKEYIAGQLARAAGGERIVFKPMMEEFLAYCDGVYFGGIFDDRFLVKITPTNEKYAMQKEIPYPSPLLGTIYAPVQGLMHLLHDTLHPKDRIFINSSESFQTFVVCAKHYSRGSTPFFTKRENGGILTSIL